jgi:endonuclease YncB( thermonuclease family)
MPRRFDITPTAAFWSFVGLLAVLSAGFTVSVEMRRSEWRPVSDATLSDGESVELVEVVDGDELSVRRGDDAFLIRMVGIKCFDSKVGEPFIRGFGAACEAALDGLARSGPLTVHLNTQPQDNAGRVLAYVHADGSDIGVRLVRDGHAVAYTPYPFEREAVYEAAQAEARSRGRGLWASPQTRARIRALQAEWAARRKVGQ